MSEKRYYAHKHLLQENKVHDKICHNFMSLDETVEHMNNQYWKYKQLKEENEQLKNHIKTLQNNTKRLENQNIETYNLIKEAYKNERTALGRSVLKQLIDGVIK